MIDSSQVPRTKKWNARDLKAEKEPIGNEMNSTTQEYPQDGKT